MEGFHILLVEDDETIAKNLKQILQQKGAQVTLDRTGDSVFNVLNDVHIIIMDIMLPNNDGLSITDEIRRFLLYLLFIYQQELISILKLKV